jgi:hypothetical protein
MSNTSKWSTQPTPDLLRQAAEILRQRGLARGKFKDPNGSGSVCMLGACALAAGSDDPDDGGYMPQVVEFLAQGLAETPTPFNEVTRFNDLAADVEAVATFLEQAAQRAEEVEK